MALRGLTIVVNMLSKKIYTHLLLYGWRFRSWPEHFLNKNTTNIRNKKKGASANSNSQTRVLKNLCLALRGLTIIVNMRSKKYIHIYYSLSDLLRINTPVFRSWPEHFLNKNTIEIRNTKKGATEDSSSQPRVLKSLCLSLSNLTIIVNMRSKKYTHLLLLKCIYLSIKEKKLLRWPRQTVPNNIGLWLPL